LKKEDIKVGMCVWRSEVDVLGKDHRVNQHKVVATHPMGLIDDDNRIHHHDNVWPTEVEAVQASYRKYARLLRVIRSRIVTLKKKGLHVSRH
jgi:hypothetical protein